MLACWIRRTHVFNQNACFIDDIHHVNENGNVTVVSKMDNDLKLILHHARKNLLVVILIDGSLNTFNAEIDGKLKNIGRVSSSKK